MVVTMHDAWLFTGGCTHPLDCTRHLSGCGRCPYRHVHFRAAAVDSTAYNHRRKSRILRQSRVHVVTPCRWLLEKVDGTILDPAVASRRVIANGVDTAVFHPGEQAAARYRLGLPRDAWVVLHASAHPSRNASKDFVTMREAVARVAERAARQVIFVAAGESSPPLRAGKAEIQFVPFMIDPADLVSYYAASDVYLQGSLADTFPNTVLEAMACGRAVVATRVGGIPEQVVEADEGATGVLVPAQDVGAMADALQKVLESANMRKAMGEAALTRARERFMLERQIDEHLAMYESLLASGR
jgi:glycosyltransferase involved in cell wall biosynthesis